MFERDETDVRMAHAYLVPYAKWESKGIRATVRKVQVCTGQDRTSYICAVVFRFVLCGEH
jgi:hypothetical protein